MSVSSMPFLNPEALFALFEKSVRNPRNALFVDLVNDTMLPQCAPLNAARSMPADNAKRSSLR